MKEDYKHLFPFEKIQPKSKIVIYGAGEMGQAYLKQLQLTHYCDVVAMADKNYQKYPQMVVPVIAPENICRHEFDHVVIALRTAVAYNEMYGILRGQGVPDEKIVCIYERNQTGMDIFTDKREEAFAEVIVESKAPVKIACLVAGGIGDYVIQKRFLVEMMKMLPEAEIVIYTIKHVSFLQYLFSDCPQVHSVFEDFGVRYEQNKERYTLSMVIEACNYVQVDVFDYYAVEMINPMFAESIRHLQEEIRKDPIDFFTPVHIPIVRRLYQGCNVYSGFEYQGAFTIADQTVNIPITNRGEEFYHSLHLGKYFTVNYGNGICRDVEKVSKMWPLERFSEVMISMKREYPDVRAVQIGAADAFKIKGVDKYILGEEMDLVSSILKHALFHLDIEGGLVHIATQLGTKCIVLFGPTLEEYYGYKENINIHEGKCQGCFGLYPDTYRCARGMEKPECMYSITAEIVMEYIRKFMKSIGFQPCSEGVECIEEVVDG